MYFLYIYRTMSKTKSRIMLIPEQKLSNLKEGTNLLDYIANVGEIVNTIDDDTTLMGICEHVDLKKRHKSNFKSSSYQLFHEKILRAITDIDGTEFLIFNN